MKESALNQSVFRLIVAMHMLSIWDPSRWDWYPNEIKKKQQQLFYRAKGIVLHDRALNGESYHLG